MIANSLLLAGRLPYGHERLEPYNVYRFLWFSLRNADTPINTYWVTHATSQPGII